MAWKGRSTEKIIAALREADVSLGQGDTVGMNCWSVGISKQTYYEGSHKYLGLNMDLATRHKEFECENERLK